MAAVPCSKCTAERKGFRRELDSWRYKLIHCVGFESIIEGICGAMLTRDLKLFDDCEPKEVDDWSPETNCSHCSFCNLPLDKDQTPATASPLSSPSDYSPCQATTISESSQTAQRFLQAVFHKKDVSLGCDSNIPQIAEELMKKMIHQFAMEYASKCLLHTTPMDVATRTSSPFFETPDAPLDLTVSRPLGEKERESNTDGVLDLSKNNGAGSTTSTSSTSNAKASGYLLPSDEEASEDTQPRKCHQESALAVVLSSLCPAHRSLLYQMLKLAHKERLLSSPDRVLAEAHCCHGGVKSSAFHLLSDCGHRGCRSTMFHPRHTMPNHGIPKFPLKDYRSVAPSGPHNCRMQRCRMDTYTVVCHKSLHCICCQGLTVDPINNIVCSFDPCTPVCCKHHNCPPCVCVPNHTHLTQLKNTSDIGGDGDPPCPVLNREQSPFPPPLSPIPLDIDMITDEMPPSLCHHTLEEEALITDTAIPEEIECRKNQSGTLLKDVFNRFSEKLDTIRPAEKDLALVYPAIHVTEKEQLESSSTSQNLQDAHLTEIITTVLHTRSGSDYNLTDLVSRHQSQEPRSPNTRLRRRQEVQAAMATPADSTMTRRQSLQIKRELAVYDSRRTYNRRKVVQARRSQIKDGNVAVNTASTLLDSNVIQEETETELNIDDPRVQEVPLNIVSAQRDLNGIKDMIQTGEISADEKHATSADRQNKICNQCSQDDNEQSQVMTSCNKISDAMIFENASFAQGGATNKCDHRPDRSHNPTEDSPGQRSPPKESRRSKRNIVPPQRFSSYVTEPRKMFFVACFSESIFSQRIDNAKVFTSTTSDALLKNVHVKDASMKSSEKDSPLCSCDLPEALEFINSEWHSPCHAESNEQSQTVAQTSPKRSGSKTASRRLQYPNVGVTTRSAACTKTPCNTPVQYISPIKLMFVTPLKDKQGIKYRLKSVRSGSNAQAEEPFDPCKESSWAGTTEKKQNTTLHQSSTSPGKTAFPLTKSGSTPAKSPSASLKSASPLKSGSGAGKSLSSPNVPLSSLRRSTSSPPKSASAPLKSNSKSPSPSPKSSSASGKPTASPKLVSSSPKLCSRRLGECTSPESQRSPGDLQSFHETTSPKRRPGRPKKLGPHLEQKVKRPIGRPRKQKPEDTAPGAKGAKLPDVEENVNKNLKITVVYGRSRRNKRMVSESFDKLQTEFQDAWRAASLKKRLGVLTRKSEINLDNSKIGSANFGPMKDPSSYFKCQKSAKTLPSRKPGRPAKVKISGISVTVTTVSPKQRKILIERSPDRQINKKTLLPEFQSVKEPRTIGKHLQAEEQRESQSVSWPNQPVAVRQSKRVSKPSICFLHAVATSTTRSYSHSNALLRRSKKLLLNKASHKRKQEEKQSRVERSGMKRQHCDLERKNISKELTRVAGVSVDSIFAPKEAFRWWPASAEEQALKQELARRIRLISDTWVSDTVENHQVDIKVKVDTDESKSSVVQTLFNCPPNKPRSCSMPQLCSWFMQTTETQSLAIVKKASSRNPYEVMHFPRLLNKHGVHRQSPQAERLRRHLKKFAKTLPKSPVQLKQAERRLKRMRAPLFIRNIKRRLFITRMVSQGRSSQYQATLLRARTRFLTPQQRKRWAKKLINFQEPSCRLKLKASNTAAKEVQSQQDPNISSNAWNAQSLKECRVFLRKINESEDWDSCPLTLDDKSASVYINKELQRVVQAVKRRKTSTNGRGAEPVPETPTGRQKEGTCPHDVSAEAPQPPPAKRVRQSRLKGLSGPRWCDFVFGNYLPSFLLHY
ncbi:uncharacterized protein lcorl isoform X2 [Dunckerocampus dactyliophorus]|uniref:uncharacterized protein lcorl isoform X2 n=1 Tax=Dunckerocampus dactyliophorus TaxID=161453 RepID=UPI00240743D1|nr:uncharacterized protein lcorl isoform X2 [Dunckerocampus dactyliophorus]